jgi:hypothetical protein
MGCGTNGNSNVRVVNASPGLTTNFAVQVGLTNVASNLPYGKVGVEQQGTEANDTSGIYRPVGSGTNQKLVLYGPSPSDIIASGTHTLVRNSFYTFVTLGNKAANVTLVTLADNGTAPANGGAGLRIVQASSAAGAVDIYVTAVGVPLSGATPTLSGAGFGDITAYLPVPAAKDEIRVTPHGNPSNVLIDVTSTLTGGGLYTAYALDPQTSSSTAKYSMLITGDPVTTATSSK